MRADGISIQDFFHTERRHVVPLYQRPYVWKREDQWEPLSALNRTRPQSRVGPTSYSGSPATPGHVP